MAIIGFALIVVVGALTWFWLLASVPRTEAGEVTLEVEQPPVSVQSGGEGSFVNADDGMTLREGDVVKTGAGGRATIHFFGLAETRLDEGTSLVVRDASQGSSAPDALNVRLQVQAGRVWSRVLRLFDLDSEYAVETPGIVATVRGTAFSVGVEADGSTEIAVTDSAVGVLPTATSDRVVMIQQLQLSREAFAEATTNTQVLAGATETALGALPAGEVAYYSAAGTPISHRLLTDADRQEVWFLANAQADARFISDVQERRRAELAALGGARPDQLTAGITALSEQVHLLFAGEERTEEQLEQYLVRRIARLLDLVEAGKSGLASQEFARLENEIRTGMRGEDGDMVRVRARAAFVRTVRLLEHALPSSPLYPFKQRMEDLLVALQEGDTAAALFTRLVAIDVRIDEASQLLDNEELDVARVALDAARGGISNVSRDAEPVLPTVTVARQEALVGKILALIVREQAERARWEAQRDGVFDDAATSTMPALDVPTSTPPVVTPPAVTTSTAAFTGIRLAVGVGTLRVGVPTDIAVIADRADGTNQNVTAQATFQVLRGDGTLNGPQFTPTVAGTIVIQASYNDGGRVHVTQTAVTAAGAPVFQSLSVLAGSTDIKSGTSVTLSARATYSDGSTRDIDPTLVTWSFTPTTAGRVVGGTFTGMNSTGTPIAVTLQGSYTEGTITQRGTVGITVR